MKGNGREANPNLEVTDVEERADIAQEAGDRLAALLPST